MELTRGRGLKNGRRAFTPQVFLSSSLVENGAKTWEGSEKLCLVRCHGRNHGRRIGAKMELKRERVLRNGRSAFTLQRFLISALFGHGAKTWEG